MSLKPCKIKTLCNARKAEREAEQAEKRHRERTRRNAQYWEANRMSILAQRHVRRIQSEAMNPRINCVMAMDLPESEKQARIRIIVEQERDL